MPRRLIAFLIACYAIAFAFGAMAAVRWPSLMMVADLIVQQDPAQHIANMDWRRVGIAHGAPYFLAALCLYASAVSITNRRRGSILWYLFGCTAGFPCIFLVSFHDGWWMDPTPGEGAIVGAAAGAVLLLVAVWELRIRSAKPVGPEESDIVPASRPPQARQPKRRRKRYGPVPPAIALQRRLLAEQGAQLRARHRRQ